MIRRIEPGQVRLGMYVRGFGGSFFSHPFWRTRFKLTSQTDVDILRNCAVPYIEIDEALGCALIEHDEAAAPVPPPATRSPPAHVPAVTRQFAVRRVRTRPPEAPVSPEQARAERTVTRGKVVVKALFDSARLGQAVPVAEAMSLVAEMDDLFARGEHKLLDVIRMKTADEYTYLHSVAVCALMLKLARQLGMAESEARECGLAGLLHDVGKMRVPADVLHKRGALTDAEYLQVQAHAEEGFAMLSVVPDLPEAAMTVARLHHEKIDGTGYPLQLLGEAIPLVARMGAICDVYDALTSNRAYKQAWTPAKALEAMAGWDGHFDGPLLEAFAASVGIALPPAPVEPV